MSDAGRACCRPKRRSACRRCSAIGRAIRNARLFQTFGGNDQTLAAVHRGLSWLEAHQHADGYWSFNRFYNQERGQQYGGQGSVQADAAATGFALLPFLGDGHTHLTGDHQAAVRKGLQWLVKHQKPDGDLSWHVGGNWLMYCHAIAAIAVCEAYGMTKDPDLQGPAQRAVDFIVKAQNSAGRLCYHPRETPTRRWSAGRLWR